MPRSAPRRRAVRAYRYNGAYNENKILVMRRIAVQRSVRPHLGHDAVERSQPQRRSVPRHHQLHPAAKRRRLPFWQGVP